MAKYGDLYSIKAEAGSSDQQAPDTMKEVVIIPQTEGLNDHVQNKCWDVSASLSLPNPLSLTGLLQLWQSDLYPQAGGL